MAENAEQGLEVLVRLGGLFRFLGERWYDQLAPAVELSGLVAIEVNPFAVEPISLLAHPTRLYEDDFDDIRRDRLQARIGETNSHGSLRRLDRTSRSKKRRE